MNKQIKIILATLVVVLLSMSMVLAADLEFDVKCPAKVDAGKDFDCTVTLSKVADKGLLKVNLLFAL